MGFPLEDVLGGMGFLILVLIFGLITLSYASGDRLIPFFANFNRILLVDILIKILFFYINKL